MNGPTRARRAHLDALQARFALRVASRLSERADALPHDLSERLRVAREQAVQQARGQPPSGWLRLASLLPLLLLVAGLLAIQHLHTQAEIHAAADVDAALLADDLPPEAYGDPGFVAFLRQPEP
jgi:Protein of unknown function (DUF3619)